MLTTLSGSSLLFTSKIISGFRKNKKIQYGASGRIVTLKAAFQLRVFHTCVHARKS